MRRFVVSGEVNEQVVALELDVPNNDMAREKQAAIVRQCYIDLGIEVLNVGVMDCMVHELRLG